MQKRNLALGVALAFVGATAFADGASSRHPSGSSSSGSSSSGSSGGSSVSSGSSGSSSGSSSSPSTPSGGSSFSGSSRGSRESSERGSSAGRSGGSSSTRRSPGTTGRHPSETSNGDRRGHSGGDRGRVRVYGPYGSSWGYDPYYGGYYGGYYDGYYGYGWRGAYPGYHYVYNANYGSLRIMVQPDDTEVYVDGYYAGEVDAFNGIFQRLNVRPGRHEIALKRAGYRTHRLRIYVPVGATLKIRHDMERGANLQPTEAVIGEPEDVEEPATTARDEPAESDEAESMAGEQAEVTLTVRPADASVYVDGVFRGSAGELGALELDPGRHRIEVVRPGYATYQKDVTLRPGQEVEQRVDLQRSAGEL